jgi:hypothetical protein
MRIKKQIKKEYLKDRFGDGEMKLNGIIEKTFDEHRKLTKINKLGTFGEIKVESGVWHFQTFFNYDNNGNIIEELHYTPLRSSKTFFANKYDKVGLLIGYERIIEKYDNIFTQPPIKDKIHLICDIKSHYENDLIIKQNQSKKMIDESFTYQRMIMDYKYDRDGELLSKRENIKYYSNEEILHYEEINNHSFYYDHNGNKVEELDNFSSENKKSKIQFGRKYVNKHNERIVTDKDGDLVEKRHFTYDEHKNKIKEEVYNVNGLLMYSDYEYEFFD